MTFKERYDESEAWQRKVHIITTFHFLMKALNNSNNKRKWTLNLTADYFDISIGTVSESLLLMRNLKEVRECKTRKEALFMIKSKSVKDEE